MISEQQLEDRIDELETRIGDLEQQLDEKPRRLEAHTSLDAHTAEPTDRIVQEVNEEASEQRSLRRTVKDTIGNFESEYGEAAPIDYVHKSLREEFDGGAVLETIDRLREEGEIYEPTSDNLRTV